MANDNGLLLRVLYVAFVPKFIRIRIAMLYAICVATAIEQKYKTGFVSLRYRHVIFCESKDFGNIEGYGSVKTSDTAYAQSFFENQGKYRYIILSDALLLSSFKFIKKVVKHEYAHQLVYKKFKYADSPNYIHSTLWAKMCRKLGYKLTRQEKALVVAEESDLKNRLQTASAERHTGRWGE